VRGCRERLAALTCVLAALLRAALLLAVLAVPAVGHAKSHAKPAASAPAGQPPTQVDFFQSLSLGSSKEPINITADALELDYKGSVLTYSGNVKVVQADTTLTSDTLAITYDRQAVQQREPAAAKSADAPAAAPSAGEAAPADAPASATKAAEAPARGGSDADKIKEVVAEGHVRITRGDRVAEGRRAVFDQAKQTIVLSDGAVLHEGPNQVTGDRIIVYLREERSVVESSASSRVNAVFYPNAGASPAMPSSGASPGVPPAVGETAKANEGGR